MQETYKQIKQVYKDVLRRDVDEASLNFYSDQLKNGIITIETIKLNLKNSDEFLALFKIKNKKDIINTRNYLKKYTSEYIKQKITMRNKILSNEDILEIINLTANDFEEKISIDDKILILGLENEEMIKKLSKLSKIVTINQDLESVRNLNQKLISEQNIIVYRNNFLDLTIFPDSYFKRCYVFNENALFFDKKFTKEFLEKINTVIKIKGCLFFQLSNNEHEKIKDKLENTFELLNSKNIEFKQRKFTNSILLIFKFKNGNN